MIKITDKSVSQNVYPRNFSSGTFSRNYYYYYYYYYIYIFFEDCPDQCSGKGRCVNSTCQCMIGWSGDNCQLGKCMLVTLQLKLAAHS